MQKVVNKMIFVVTLPVHPVLRLQRRRMIRLINLLMTAPVNLVVNIIKTVESSYSYLKMPIRS